MTRDSLQIYSEFLDSLFRNHRKDLVQLGITTRRYYYLAEIQISELESNLKKWMESFSDKSNKIDYSEKVYSHGFGFYTLIRTCLEASKRLSDEMHNQYGNKELENYRQQHSKEIGRIIKIANDIVKHPLHDDSRNKEFFYEPGGLDNSGEFDIYEWSVGDEDHSKFQILIRESIVK